MWRPEAVITSYVTRYGFSFQCGCGKQGETVALPLTNLTSIQQRPILWKIECWIEVFLTAQKPMKEQHDLQFKFTKAFDVCLNNFMPTSHFLCYACFWILIATTGTFQLICIMNSVIIQRQLLGNKHAICPQIEFYNLFCISASCGYCFGRHLYNKFHVAGLFCASLISLLKLIVLFVGVFLAVFLSVLVWTFMLQQPCVHIMSLCVCIFMDARLPAQIWRLVVRSFEGWRNLRGRLKYCAVIGIALSSVSSINVQFSI